jgi:hypothetical protein
VRGGKFFSYKKCKRALSVEPKVFLVENIRRVLHAQHAHNYNKDHMVEGGNNNNFSLLLSMLNEFFTVKYFFYETISCFSGAAYKNE